MQRSHHHDWQPRQSLALLVGQALVFVVALALVLGTWAVASIAG
jgi:hypothetical protein